MNTIKFDKKETGVIAHRGLSGIETENTHSAFVAAGNRSYVGIETDVHVTADEKFVIIHDDVTGRVCENSINVEESTLEEIRALKLKNIRHAEGGEEYFADCRGDLIVPTLSEYIGICRKYGKKCVLEIKNRFETKHIKMLVEEIKKLNYLENVIFISFKLDNLVELRVFAPDNEIQYLVKEYNKEISDYLNKFDLELDIWDQALTEDIINEVHRNGHKVNCWTCDDKEYAGKLSSWGVDYITTNILE